MDRKISFNIPPSAGNEITYMQEAMKNGHISGDGAFTKKCSRFIEERFGVSHSLLTTSCTHALEMGALLCGVQPGDEVILPSYTFVSTANAFVQRGATLVFVDIRPDTMNIDENLIEKAITAKTKVIVPVHYAGVACEMDKILSIAERHGLRVVEDAAQGFGSKYKNRYLGTLGDLGCFSFHETKNYSMGEGGAIVFEDDIYREQAEILREKGTNRSKFFRGQIDKYTWQDYGSSYLPSDLNAAYLWAQLEQADVIAGDRMDSYNYYTAALAPLAEEGLLELPAVPAGCEHNAHMFYIKLPDLAQRSAFIAHLKTRGILCVFHYIPLHSAPAGQKYGRFCGEDRHTTKESERLVRLPMYYGLAREDQRYIVDCIKNFFNFK